MSLKRIRFEEVAVGQVFANDLEEVCKKTNTEKIQTGATGLRNALNIDKKSDDYYEANQLVWVTEEDN